jgi:hypothetical protein
VLRSGTKMHSESQMEMAGTHRTATAGMGTQMHLLQTGDKQVSEAAAGLA